MIDISQTIANLLEGNYIENVPDLYALLRHVICDLTKHQMHLTKVSDCIQ